MSNEELTTNQGTQMTPLSSNLPNLSKYMSFIGLLSMIGGVLYCLTIIGAIIGVPYFIMGKRLRESAEAFAGYNASNSAGDLETAIEKQTRAFFIMYVLAIIGLVLLAIYLVVIIGILLAGGF
jgi:flagellar biogenesis protein FliO